jgi:hypothetical protein
MSRVETVFFTFTINLNGNGLESFLEYIFSLDNPKVHVSYLVVSSQA